VTGDELYCKRILTNGEEEDTLGATGVKGDVLYCCGGSDGRPPLSMGQTYRKASLKKKSRILAFAGFAGFAGVWVGLRV